MSVLVPLVTFAVGASAEDSEDPIAALEDSIWVLRGQGKYAEALEVANEILSMRQADSTAKEWQITDVTKKISTLRSVIALGDDARQELAQADSLWKAMWRLEEEGSYDEAALAAEQQLEIRKGILGEEHPEVPHSLNALGLFRHHQGKYAEAVSAFRESLAMRRKLIGEEHPDVAQSLSNLAYLLQDQGNYAEAEPMFREALAMRRRLLGEEHPDVANTLNNLSILLYTQGRYDEAEAALLEALEINRKIFGEQHIEVIANLDNLGALCLVQGRYPMSEAYHRQALSQYLSLRGTDHPDIALCLSNLAAALDAQGKYAEGQACHRKALAMHRRFLGEEHPDVAIDLNNLGLSLFHQGRYGEAEPLLRETLGMRRRLLGDEHPLVGMDLSNLAAVLRAIGRSEEAEANLRQSLAIFRNALGDKHPHVAKILNNLGYSLQVENRCGEAEQLFREALIVYRNALGEEHPDIATSLNNLANALAAQRKYEEAGTVFRESLAMRQTLFGKTHPGVAKNLTELGCLLCATSDYSEAQEVFAEAAARYDVARIRAGTGLERATFASSPYSYLACTCMTLDDGEGGWEAAERGLARALFDLLEGAHQRTLSPLEVAREDSLREYLSHLERQLETYLRMARADTTADAATRVKKTRDRLLVAEAEWSAFQQEMAEKYPVTEGQAFPLQRVQGALSARAAIVGWLDVEMKKGEYDSWGYVIRDSGPVRWARVEGASGRDDEQTPFERARAFRDAIAQAPGFMELSREDAHDLWVERMAPLVSTLEGVEDLIVLPSGAMLGVPVESLVDAAGELVGDRYSVSYVPSAAIYTWLTEKGRGSQATGRALLVGDPPFAEEHLAAMEGMEMTLAAGDAAYDPELLRSAMRGSDEALGSLRRLAGSRREVSGIAAVCSEATVLVGAEASEQELVSLAESGRLGEFDTIHFATHALMDDERPEESALVLCQVSLPDPLEAAMAGTRIYDGLLRAKEIVREWDLDADLVTLSACETGLGKEVMGEGYIGFSHAFLQAGARSLLVSLRKVEDEPTSLLMRRFYENRAGIYEADRGLGAGRPMSKAQALQEAKHWLCTYEDDHGNRPYEHPHYWSAFILIGDRR